MRPFALFVLLAAAASAQPAPEPGRIVGVVADAETGDPLIGANVWLVGTRIGAATDVEGRYAIEAVLPGEHLVRASYVGFDLVEDTVRVGAGETVAWSPSLRMVALVGCPVVCYDVPIVPEGVYTARVVRYDPRELGQWCRPLSPGESVAEAR